MGGITGMFLTLWLSLFCHHCLAGMPSAKTGSGQPDRIASGLHAGHQGATEPACDGHCLDAHALQQDWPGGETWMATSPLFHVIAPIPPAITVRQIASVNGPLPLFRPPDRAVRHPLTLTSIQTK